MWLDWLLLTCWICHKEIRVSARSMDVAQISAPSADASFAIFLVHVASRWPVSWPRSSTSWKQNETHSTQVS